MNLTKLLHPKTCVRVIYFDKDKRARGYYKVPKNGTITIGNKTHIIDNKSPVLFSGKFPAYVLLSTKVKPIDPYSLTDDTVLPEDLEAVLNSSFLRDIARAQGNGMDKKLMLFGGIIMIVVIGAVYFLYQEISAMKTSIDNLQTLLDNLLRANGIG